MKNMPLEIEHKFLIAYPDVSVLTAQEGAAESHIVQTYLTAPQGVTERVRARTKNGKTVYTHTKKTRLTALTAIEEEQEISLAEYTSFLERADKNSRPVEKRRYAIPYASHMLEVDVYPFWQKQAVLEIELKDENEAYEIPPYITVIREVTADMRYKNKSLAKQIPAED